MAKSPAFQYYPKDFISDPEVMFWDCEQVGAYWLLINILWENEGTFELNLSKFRVIFRKKTEKSAQRLWEKISKKFILKNGVISHKRVDEEIKKQDTYRVKRSEAGKKGAQERWKKDGKRMISPLAKNSSSSSSSSSSSIVDTNVSTGKPEKVKTKKRTPAQKWEYGLLRKIISIYDSLWCEAITIPEARKWYNMADKSLGLVIVGLKRAKAFEIKKSEKIDSMTGFLTNDFRNRGRYYSDIEHAEIKQIDNDYQQAFDSNISTFKLSQVMGVKQ